MSWSESAPLMSPRLPPQLPTRGRILGGSVMWRSAVVLALVGVLPAFPVSAVPVTFDQIEWSWYITAPASSGFPEAVDSTSVHLRFTDLGSDDPTYAMAEVELSGTTSVRAPDPRLAWEKVWWGFGVYGDSGQVITLDSSRGVQSNAGPRDPLYGDHRPVLTASFTAYYLRQGEPADPLDWSATYRWTFDPSQSHGFDLAYSAYWENQYVGSQTTNDAYTFNPASRPLGAVEVIATPTPVPEPTSALLFAAALLWLAASRRTRA